MLSPIAQNSISNTMTFMELYSICYLFFSFSSLLLFKKKKKGEEEKKKKALKNLYYLYYFYKWIYILKAKMYIKLKMQILASVP